MLLTYDQLLDAVIHQLEDLKSRGTQFVPVDAQALARLREPVPAGAPRPRQQSVVPTPRPPSVPLAETLQESPPPSAVNAAPPARSAPPAPLDPAAKETAMAQLRERALLCQKCPHLVRSRTQVVFGVGDMHSPLMFIGEAPGMDEDQQGEPFVGRAGQLLTRIIETMGFTRQTVYIANILKCRPDTPGQTAGNRKPTAEEMKTCLPYLLAQVDLIQPKVIVTLGATAMEGLSGSPVYITKIRGRFTEFRGIPVMPTYHPSYLLRNQALATKREVWEDMLQVLEKLERPISEKQRSYFLKAQGH